MTYVPKKCALTFHGDKRTLFYVVTTFYIVFLALR